MASQQPDEMSRNSANHRRDYTSIEPLAHQRAFQNARNGDTRGAEDFDFSEDPRFPADDFRRSLRMESELRKKKKQDMRTMPPPPPRKRKRSSKSKNPFLRSLNNMALSSTKSRSSSRSSSRESREEGFPRGVVESMFEKPNLSQRQHNELLDVIKQIDVNSIGIEYPLAFQLPFTPDPNTNDPHPLPLNPSLDEPLQLLDQMGQEIQAKLNEEANNNLEVLARIDQCYLKNYSISRTGRIDGIDHPYGSYKIGTAGKTMEQGLLKVKNGVVSNPNIIPVDVPVDPNTTDHVIGESPQYDEDAFNLLTTLWFKTRAENATNIEKIKMETWLNNSEKEDKIKFVKTLLLQNTRIMPPRQSNAPPSTRDIIAIGPIDTMLNSIRTFLVAFEGKYPGLKYISGILFALLNTVYNNRLGKALQHSLYLPIMILIYQLIKNIVKDTGKKLEKPLKDARDQLDESYTRLLYSYEIQKDAADEKFKEFSDKFADVFNGMTQIVRRGEVGTVIARMLHELLDVVAFVINDPEANQRRIDQGRVFVALHATIDTMVQIAPAVGRLNNWAGNAVRYLLGIDRRIEPTRGRSSSSSASSGTRKSYMPVFRGIQRGRRPNRSSRKNDELATDPDAWRDKYQRPHRDMSMRPQPPTILPTNNNGQIKFMDIQNNPQTMKELKAARNFQRLRNIPPPPPLIRSKSKSKSKSKTQKLRSRSSERGSGSGTRSLSRSRSRSPSNSPKTKKQKKHRNNKGS